MEIKLFGKSLFEFRKGAGQLMVNDAINRLKDTEFLPDFHAGMNRGGDGIYLYSDAIAAFEGTPKEKKQEIPASITKLTPKEIHALGSLNDADYKIRCDAQYVDALLDDFRQKLTMIEAEKSDMRNAAVEIGSMVIRLGNRKHYAKYKEFYDQFPYTTQQKVAELLERHDYLKMDKVAAFLADMPKEAMDKMREYEKQTVKLCGKKPLFYIIADKKDFQRTEKRRDPILLAQSPFAHAWNVLGAWDKELLLLGEL